MAVSGWSTKKFVRCLHAAHDDGWIDVEVRATYDPATNMGTFSLEVILLFKVSTPR